jgi:hypothetical protein
MVTIILSEMGSLFYIHKAIIPNILANSSRIDARTGEMKPGKVNLYIYASIISSETILKLPLQFRLFRHFALFLLQQKVQAGSAKQHCNKVNG